VNTNVVEDPNVGGAGRVEACGGGEVLEWLSQLVVA
jgi:hypothetical protein